MEAWFIWYIGIWVLVGVLSILDASIDRYIEYKKKPFYYRDHYPINDDH